MNEKMCLLERFDRDTIEKGLLELPEFNQMILKSKFKHKFNPNSECKDFDNVIEDISVSQLHWAIDEVITCIKNLKRLEKN